MTSIQIEKLNPSEQVAAQLWLALGHPRQKMGAKEGRVHVEESYANSLGSTSLEGFAPVAVPGLGWAIRWDPFNDTSIWGGIAARLPTPTLIHLLNKQTGALKQMPLGTRIVYAALAHYA